MVDDEESAAGDEYVVCTNCGARIKATRERCLRCFEPLHRDHSELPVWRTLKISDQVGMAVGGIALIAIAGLVYVLWTTADRSIVDSTAMPVEKPNALVAPPAPQGAAPAKADAAAPPPANADAAPADDLESTRRSFEQKLKVDPNDPVALSGLGIALEGLGRFPDALASLKHAVEVAPGNATPRLNLARLEARMGQWDKAVVDYRVVARLTPGDPDVHYNLALALQQTRDDQAAIESFQTAIELAPREAVAHRGLAISLEKVGRAADAAREYERYLELAPDAPDIAAIRDRLQRLSRM